MTPELIYIAAAAVALAVSLPRFLRRLQLSRAKHPSLGGHARMSRRLARQLPNVVYDGDKALSADGAPAEIVRRRQTAFEALAKQLNEKAPTTTQLSASVESSISDVQFTNAYRVPFQFRDLVRKNLRIGAFAEATKGVKVRNLDGTWAYDLGGSYGVNLLGYDFYKQCIDKGADRVRELGPMLGPYHPVIAENVSMLREISGQDEVSFHMSGTEAVMQAVRLARYHTGRSQLVMSTGAYHGWWDGVQPGIGNRRPPNDIYMLKDMSEDTLRVLRSRKDIACVLINPLQALHPNSSASSDATLINSERKACFDRDAYGEWLRQVRDACTANGIVLILDEVFVGFRLGLGGAQEYFGVRADMVTYGKTLGGGLPVGAVCGKAALMKRYKDDRPTDVCFARGTFNSHPYVMASMNEFLRYVTSGDGRTTGDGIDATWNARADELNRRLEEHGLPVRVNNMTSIWMLTYTVPSRYNWMLQFYLRAEGLSLSWVGTGRFIFSHNYTDDDIRDVGDRLIAAAKRMREDGWWWQSESLTNKAIKREVLREFLAARLGRRSAGSNGPARPPSVLPAQSRDAHGS